MTKTSKTTTPKPATSRAKPGSAKAAEPVRVKPAQTAAAAPPPTKRPSKLDSLTALLRRAEGATIEELTVATGWQAHSVRGAISGALKKKLGLTVASEKVDSVRRYRIVEAAA